MRLEGKNALVTGSDQGIGQAVAIRLAEEGASVVVNYRKNHDGAEQTSDRIASLGRRAAVIQADVGVVAEASRLVGQAVEALGSIDILVNNAGIEKNASFLDVTEQDYSLVMNVNLTGPFFATQAFARHCRDRGGRGRVINISSVHE